MLFDYFKKIVTPKRVTYNYTLSAKEVSEALYEIFINKKQADDYDISGGFISENEFEYHLKNGPTFRGLQTFPMYGIIISQADNTAKLTLESKSKFTAYGFLIISGIIAFISLILFIIHWDIKSLLLFLGMVFLAPRIIRMYIESVNSALLIRYKKYLHNGILEAFRLKNYPS